MKETTLADFLRVKRLPTHLAHWGFIFAVNVLQQHDLPSGWVFQQILELKKSHFKPQSSEVMLFISAAHQMFQVFLLALAMSLSLRVGGDVHRVLASGMWARGTCHFCVEGLRTSVQPAVLHTSFHFVTTVEANARWSLVRLAHWMAMTSNAQWTRNVNKRTLAARNQWDLETIVTAAQPSQFWSIQMAVCVTGIWLRNPLHC